MNGEAAARPSVTNKKHPPWPLPRNPRKRAGRGFPGDIFGVYTNRLHSHADIWSSPQQAGTCQAKWLRQHRKPLTCHRETEASQQKPLVSAAPGRLMIKYRWEWKRQHSGGMATPFPPRGTATSTSSDTGVAPRQVTLSSQPRGMAGRF